VFSLLIVTLHAMRPCLALFFLILFSFQLLPLKGIGRLMNKSANTSEVQDCSDDNTDGDLAQYSCDQLLSSYSFDFSTNHLNIDKEVSALIIKASSLLSVPVDKIPSPPPEC
jgi:hypothetical protein